MGRKCKCRTCKEIIEVSEAYIVFIGKQKAFYCNEEEYRNDIAEKEQKKVVGGSCKCKICGAKLNTENAYLVITESKKVKRLIKSFYCSKEEYEKDRAKKDKAKLDKDKAYWLICDILGRKEIINTALWDEWEIWKRVASNEVIGQYLEENKEYLKSVISRLDDVEFNRIRYLSAILKNKLGDYKPKVAAKETEKPKIKVDETLYEITSTTRNRRRSLADLEDEF